MNDQDRSEILNFEEDIPRDNLLPALTTFLVPRTIALLIASRLRNYPGEIRECGINYMRYKPGTNCIVAYRLEGTTEFVKGASEILFYAKIYTKEDYLIAAEKARTHRWVPMTYIDPVIFMPEFNTILYMFPNDCLMEGLRLLSNPKKIQRLLYEHYDKFPENQWRISDRKLKLSTARHKPERRVVMRCDSKATNIDDGRRETVSVYLRTYADDRGRDIYSLQDRLYQLAAKADKFKIPKPIAYLPERKLFMMESLSGRQLLDELLGNNGVEAVRLTAQALAYLNRADTAGIQVKRIETYLDEAVATVDMLRHITPETQAEAGECLYMLLSYRYLGENPLPGFVHGDFYYGQVLSEDSRVGIIDFDRSHSGDVTADIGNFCAHLKLLRIEGRLKEDGKLERNFRDAYRDTSRLDIESERINFWTAFGLFQLSVGPFRRLEPGWRQMIREILLECRKILRS